MLYSDLQKMLQAVQKAVDNGEEALGCDIHTYVEVLKNGQWQLTPDQIGPCDHCGGTGQNPDEFYCRNCHKDEDAHDPKTKKCLFSSGHWEKVGTPCWWHCNGGIGPKEDLWYTGNRNYTLFGVLSDVRGNADPNFTIKDRGLPDDVCAEVAKAAEGADWHSHGYYTLAELEARDWVNEYRSMATSDVITREEYKALPDDRRWIMNYSEIKKTIKKMRREANKPGVDDVRLVFWYDN